MTKKADESLEEGLKDLEAIVQQLERGNLGLEKSLEVFEKGIKIYKNCRKQISSFEKRIGKLTEDLKEEKWDID